MKLFQPVITGKGATIENAPSEPKHAVRLEELDGRIKAYSATFTQKDILIVEKKSAHFTVTVVGTDGYVIIPGEIRETNETLTIHFSEPRSGRLTVIFVGD